MLSPKERYLALRGGDCLWTYSDRTVSDLPISRMKEFSHEVTEFSTPTPFSFVLAAPFLTFVFLSVSIFQALHFKSLFAWCHGRLFCRTEEQDWVWGWTDEGALIGHRQLQHVPPYSSIALSRPLPNSHLSCQSFAWEQNISQIWFICFFLSSVPPPSTSSCVRPQ